MDKSSKIPFIIFITLSVICLVLAIAILFAMGQRGPSKKDRLYSIASNLPKFDGHSVSEGELTDGNCFGINESSNLRAIRYMQPIAAGTFDQVASEYKQAVTQSQGITWTEGSRPWDGIQSDPFTRDGRHYTLTVNEYSQPKNHLGISLTACD